jgi:hypothetical protein
MLVYEEVRAAFETVTTKVTRGRRLRSPDGKEAPDFQDIVADDFFFLLAGEVVVNSLRAIFKRKYDCKKNEMDVRAHLVQA